MKLKPIYVLLAVFICAVASAGQNKTSLQSVSLYSPLSLKYDDTRAWFDFERGERTKEPKWDLEYGCLRIGEDYDWFSASQATDNRSLIRDLGELNWNDDYEVPVIEPLPNLEEGKTRSITVDSSGDTGKAWAKSNGIFVKAIVGHLYAMHVKDTDSDFYVLFRVESIARGESCTIFWRLTDAPEKSILTKDRA